MENQNINEVLEILYSYVKFVENLGKPVIGFLGYSDIMLNFSSVYFKQVIGLLLIQPDMKNTFFVEPLPKYDFEKFSIILDKLSELHNSNHPIRNAIFFSNPKFSEIYNEKETMERMDKMFVSQND